MTRTCVDSGCESVFVWGESSFTIEFCICKFKINEFCEKEGAPHAPYSLYSDLSFCPSFVFKTCFVTICNLYSWKLQIKFEFNMYMYYHWSTNGKEINLKWQTLLFFLLFKSGSSLKKTFFFFTKLSRNLFSIFDIPYKIGDTSKGHLLLILLIAFTLKVLASYWL